MSLINDLLTNLEQREGNTHQGVLAGLAAAEATQSEPPLQDRPKSIGLLLMLAVALVVAGYLLLMRTEETNVADEKSPATAQQQLQQVEQAVAMTPPDFLKLDLTLDNILPNTEGLAEADTVAGPNQIADEAALIDANPDPATAEQLKDAITATNRPVLLEAIHAHDDGQDGLLLEFELSQQPSEWSTYTLSDPERLVLDMSIAGFDANQTRLPNSDWIGGIRHNYENGQLRLVFDMRQPLQIVDEGWMNQQGGEVFQLHLKPIYKVTADAGNHDQVAQDDHDAAAAKDESAPVVVRSGEPPQITPNRQSDSYQQALNAYQTGEFRHVLEILEPILAESVNNTAALRLQAMSLVQLQRINDALALLQPAVERLPAAYPLRQLYAQLLLNSGRDEQAIEVLATRAPSPAEAPEYHALLAAALQQNQRYQESAALYEELVQVAPKRAVWWLGLAISLEELNRGSAAIDAYRQALRAGLSADLGRYASNRINQLSKSHRS